MTVKYVNLGDVCSKGSSNIAQKDLDAHTGEYPIYGASGYIKSVDFYQQEDEYIGIVKDGAGVGRAMILPAKSSVIGTLQYIIPDKRKVNIHYLYYAIVNMELGRYFSGATIPHIYFKDYQREKFKLPDLETQENIANNLANIDSVISKKNAQINLIDELVKSRFIEMFGDPVENPKHYEKVKLSNIATYFNGLTYKPENISDKGIIILRSSNIQNSQLDFKDIVRVDCVVKDRLIVKTNDILMCSRNGSAKLVGKVALIKNINESMSFGAFMLIIRSRYYSYLMPYFQTDAFRRQIKTGATTTINQITGKMLDSIEIPLPPLDHINKFASFVEQTNKSKFVEDII